MKISEKQKHQLKIAYREISDVLSEIKKRKLRGKDIDEMNMLEDAVSAIGIVILEPLK